MSRRILLHARGQTTTCPPHAACVAVHLDPGSSSPCCVRHGLAAFCLYHSCLPRYKALADYPSSRRSPTLRSPRRLYRPSGLPTAWQTGPAQHVAYSTRHIFLRIFTPQPRTCGIHTIKLPRTHMGNVLEASKLHSVSMWYLILCHLLLAQCKRRLISER